ncbi:MAG: Fic family protein, partial [Armatimonadaceae bacterium]
MERGMQGRWETTILGGEAVRAFVPVPLPPDPPLEMDAELTHLLERASLAVGRLDGLATLLPDVAVPLYFFVRKEAVLSSQIEGTQSSLSDLLLFESEQVPGVPMEDVREVSTYVAALEAGLSRLPDLPLSTRLLCEVHAVLLSHGRGSTSLPGSIRRSQNWIGGTRPGNAHFVPPPPHLLGDCLAELERTIHGVGTSRTDICAPVPTLVKAALIHAQFETIHPFLDGNGRL